MSANNISGGERLGSAAADLHRRPRQSGRRVSFEGPFRRPVSQHRNECPVQWGDPPRSPLRNAVSIALLIVAFWGSLAAAAWVGAGWGR